ncbi:alpha/beta hydrolase family protein [Paractinoplanes rishiriensis]|uniref:Peptidase n=1 Tax=Paractinoplanes rishiriensis TaxID=1050105 RepID=A0A919KAN4_9ACTN|nr:prolyl oligopeptidase family serine peptidase [Actinoplanes rishiriensis]GIF01614.1 peptidase [Actinoplanes rishiriensis]
MTSPLPALSAAAAAAESVTFDEVRATEDHVWWLQTSPQEQGRVALRYMTDDGTVHEATAPGTSVGSDLHGYGGGAYAVLGRQAWYVDAATGNIMLSTKGDHARVVAEPRQPDECYGDLAVDRGALWCVRGTNSGDKLLRILPDGTQQVVAATDGFYGSPRPRDGTVAWLRWDSDRMPWDGSDLVVADYPNADVVNPRRVSGGRNESVTQPCWDSHGRLWFLSDRNGWWNLYRTDGRDMQPIVQTEVDLAPPEWEAGYRSFVPLPNDGAIVIEHNGFQHRLQIYSGETVTPLATPFTSFKPYLATQGRSVLGIAASPTLTPHIFRLDPERPDDLWQYPRRKASGPTWNLAVADHLRIATRSTEEINALIYPPANAAEAWCAPLIVRAHPGPTSAVNNRLDWHIQFLTSNGFAVADVDYRGSAGYGRAFRQSLYGRWGEFDVQDCAIVAEHLLAAGKTQAGQVFITGASAGGYTALHAVSKPSVFSGAVARSAIVNPTQWQTTAPRWQRPHAAALSGPAGPVRAEAVNRPTLLIHGADDHVAPIGDVAQLARQLTTRGVPCQLMILNARHDLSAQQVAASALQAELAFYRHHMSP